MKKINLGEIEILLENDISTELNNFGYIYLIENKINNKKYIGQSINIRKRISEHLSLSSKYQNNLLSKAILKYGKNSFSISIVDYANNIDELNTKEIFQIKKYKSNEKKFGYNIESGGRNAIPTEITRKKLSEARKNIKQSHEWIEKRVAQVSKPVIKYCVSSKKIIEEYSSLANAGKNNSDNLSYTQLIRRCLGLSKQIEDIIWCYKEDAINNSTPQYKGNISGYREYCSFTEKELDNMYNDYKLGVSIRELSDANKIIYSTLQKYIKKRDSIKMDVLNGKTTAICKKTKKDFKDIINKSGCLTNHIKEIYPDINLPSKYLRKKIEYETGKPWYYDYFIFQ